MKYEEFLHLIISYRKYQKNISDLHEMGFDFMGGKFNLMKPIEDILETSIKSHYGNDGWEWVGWFIYESDYGEKDWSQFDTYRINEEGVSEKVNKEKGTEIYGAFDSQGQPICYSFESLWEYLEKLKQT